MRAWDCYGARTRSPPYLERLGNCQELSWNHPVTYVSLGEVLMEDTMKRTPLIAIALLMTMNVAFAQAKHPADVRQIDEALHRVQLTSAQREQVISYRNEGERLHNSGNHAGAEV